MMFRFFLNSHSVKKKKEKKLRSEEDDTRHQRTTANTTFHENKKNSIDKNFHGGTKKNKIGRRCEREQRIRMSVLRAMTHMRAH